MISSVRLSTALIIKPYSISGAVRSFTVPHAQNSGRRVEGENNTQKHSNPTSASPKSSHSEFDPKRTTKFSLDPKRDTNDHTPNEAASGDYNRSGSRTTEYANVDKKEPYSPPGGECRYGGTMSYERNAERLEEESTKKGGNDA